MRLKGDPLTNVEAEEAISVLVNLAIPVEPFPFDARVALREALRNQVEGFFSEPVARRPDMLFGDYRS